MRRTPLGAALGVMSALQESNKQGKERQGPTLGVQCNYLWFSQLFLRWTPLGAALRVMSAL